MLLLYDGTCGFCAASVQFVLRHEHAHTLKFAALDSDLGRSVRARHPELAGLDSMIWVEEHAGEERVLTRSDAALRIANYMGGVWRLGLAARLVPRTIRDAVYDVIARHRHRLVPADGRCYLPPPDLRARFVA